jgi:hypothetical protein
MKYCIAAIKQPLLICQLLLCLLKKQVLETSIQDPKNHISLTGSSHAATIIPNQMDILHSSCNNSRPVIPLMLLDSTIHPQDFITVKICSSSSLTMGHPTSSTQLVLPAKSVAN